MPASRKANVRFIRNASGCSEKQHRQQQQRKKKERRATLLSFSSCVFVSLYSAVLMWEQGTEDFFFLHTTLRATKRGMNRIKQIPSMSINKRKIKSEKKKNASTRCSSRKTCLRFQHTHTQKKKKTETDETQNGFSAYLVELFSFA